jgi:Kef-type K+ transport system membrane component KefB
MIRANIGNPLLSIFGFGLDFGKPLSLLAAEVSAESSIVLAGVLLSLVVIYLASKLGGELSYKFGFPTVLGELLCGVLVGVSAFRLIVFASSSDPSSSSLIMTFLQATNGLSLEATPATFKAIGKTLSILSELGAIILLFEIGIESNLSELLKVGVQSTSVAVTGIVAPFVLGTFGLIFLFQVPAIPAIFAGAALTATSIGITSKVLSELGKLNSKEGQIILGAAILDDILGIIVLAVVASLAKTGKIDIASIILLIVAAAFFLVGAIALGRFFNRAFIKAISAIKTRGGVIISAMIFALSMAYIGAAIHLEAILGAFAAGLVLEESDPRKELEVLLKPIADIFVPIFFVSVGAKTDLSALNPMIPSNREGLAIAAFLVVVAIVGKVVAGFAVSKKTTFGKTVPGKSPTNRLAIGVGMIPRGEVGLVFAGIGAASGALSPALNTALVMMVIVTTFLAPPLLGVVFPHGTAKR